jgi:hypothetical protein
MAACSADYGQKNETGDVMITWGLDLSRFQPPSRDEQGQGVCLLIVRRSGDIGGRRPQGWNGVGRVRQALPIPVQRD